ncbi:MAG: saccharopine dehydrogenase C-terminal domain-containing protein, partial [Candidatus Thermoplasmatota archaeon]|nr:saccharopine dehydrogenase C-terminal domain-containing protein [Candidatus Thermoplasmatota archaeon]
MKALVLGTGMMGRAIAFDLHNYSNFDNITMVDKDRKTLRSAEKFLDRKSINFDMLNIAKTKDVKKYFEKFDLVISALPYYFNYNLSKLAIKTKTHFLDLGGNNDIVKKQRNLFDVAKKAGVTIMPDCGLAPGLVSIITKDIVENLDAVDYVKLRVGGLPQNPKPPLNYQIVFSPNGLINEYIEDAVVLENGKITKKKTMEEIEKINFPEPFGEMEAFITSGGCSILPHTYKNKIGYLDYKTIRYPGHCEKFKLLLEIGLGQEKEMKAKNQKISPRDVLIALLEKNLPAKGKDLVLLKIFSRGKKDGKET